jgi:hypothetical protein
MTSPRAVLATALLMASCSAPAGGPAPAARPPAPSTAASKAPFSTTTTTITTGERHAAGLAATDRLERRHRLAQALPHATAHYRIDFTVASDGRLAVVVTLLAVLNDPRDLARYEAELARYKAEALAFIAAQGDDPTTYTVTFLPPDP